MTFGDVTCCGPEVVACEIRSVAQDSQHVGEQLVIVVVAFGEVLANRVQRPAQRGIGFLLNKALQRHEVLDHASEGQPPRPTPHRLNEP